MITRRNYASKKEWTAYSKRRAFFMGALAFISEDGGNNK